MTFYGRHECGASQAGLTYINCDKAVTGTLRGSLCLGIIFVPE